MKHIKQTIERKIYSYDPNEFLPIFVEGELTNMNEFYGYKAKRIAGKFGRVAYKAVELLDQAVVSTTR